MLIEPRHAERSNILQGVQVQNLCAMHAGNKGHEAHE